ncbi:MAG: DUF4435 domain-containing protein [Gallionella sp.]
MSSLIANISSDYQKAANSLASKSAPTKILVRVEGVEDVSFWYGILEGYQARAGVKFDIQPYSNDSLTTGKAALAKHFDGAGAYMMICLDSDYDYLLPNRSEVAKAINQSPYIFQTYSYAIENLKCYAESLAGVCVRATHNTSPTINFSVLLEKYSAIIYELFIWNVYFASLSDTKSFTVENFCDVVKTQKMSIEDAFEQLGGRVQVKLKELQQTFPEYVSEVEVLANALQILGLTHKNCYLFIQGHTLYEAVLHFLETACHGLVAQRYQEIQVKSVEESQKQDEINKYKKSIGAPKKVLSLNDKFQNCFLYKKIAQDLEHYLARLSLELSSSSNSATAL